MLQPRKIIYVDFVEKKRSRPFAVGGGPKVTVLAFFFFLCLSIVITALYLPSHLTSGFFAPTVIAVSVLLALAVKRMVIRYHVSTLHRSMSDSRRETSNRTLH
jgi:4-hydroxybenzoate polyprenyltransferase